MGVRLFETSTPVCPLDDGQPMVCEKYRQYKDALFQSRVRNFMWKRSQTLGAEKRDGDFDNGELDIANNPGQSHPPRAMTISKMLSRRARVNSKERGRRGTCVP